MVLIHPTNLIILISMEQDKIIAGNKLIAEFHGWKHIESPKNNGEGYWNFIDWGRGHFNLEFMDYHKDWNWLMPVVEKIEQGNYGFKMCRKVVEIYYDDTKEVILKAKESSRLQSLYYAIIQFINWYNTQEQSKVNK